MIIFEIKSNFCFSFNYIILKVMVSEQYEYNKRKKVNSLAAFHTKHFYGVLLDKCVRPRILP